MKGLLQYFMQFIFQIKRMEWDGFIPIWIMCLIFGWDFIFNFS